VISGDGAGDQTVGSPDEVVLSVDGLGQKNPDRSEDLWGRGGELLEWWYITEPTVRTQHRT
jgi:hypothetical protein